jgi:hypothetical protein
MWNFLSQHSRGGNSTKFGKILRKLSSRLRVENEREGPRQIYRRLRMKLFLTAAALAVLLSTGAYAQDPSETKAAPSGQVKETAKEKAPGAGMSSSGTSASGGAMKSQTTGAAADPNQKDNQGSKDSPGQKTGVSGGRQ